MGRGPKLFLRFEGTVIMTLLERGNERDAEAWAQQLVNYISDFKFEIGDQEIGLTCTIGICAVSGAVENLDELVTGAATAHAKAKSDGGNVVSLRESQEEDTKLKRHDALWVKRIKSALADNRFRLAQLPIAGLRSNSTSMYDMLVRMEDEQGDSVLPSEFLPAAERNNLMKTIDRWIITAAIDFCAAKGAERVFVRISNQSFTDASLCDWMGSEFERQKVLPNRLCIQVAEEEAARHIKPLKTMTAQFRELGIRFALDARGARPRG